MRRIFVIFLSLALTIVMSASAPATLIDDVTKFDFNVLSTWLFEGKQKAVPANDAALKAGAPAAAGSETNQGATASEVADPSIPATSTAPNPAAATGSSRTAGNVSVEAITKKVYAGISGDSGSTEQTQGAFPSGKIVEDNPTGLP